MKNQLHLIVEELEERIAPSVACQTGYEGNYGDCNNGNNGNHGDCNNGNNGNHGDCNNGNNGNHGNKGDCK